ncbi:MAG TPA: sialidase family protein, partial [Thermoanaerobaculia bacterium]|nr:sialidase family protein [Thermoanaerobaculia bacterium]
MRKLLVAATVAVAVMVLGSAGGARAAERESPRWPTLREQMQRDRVERGTELEKLISENQDFTLLDPREAEDRLGVPLWLRVHWRKAHPELRYDFRDPTHGYPLVLKEVAEWMKTHPNFDQSRVEPELETKTYAAGANVRLSGAQSNPRSESDIRVNYWNTSKVIGASNNIGGSGQQAQWFSSDGGASWSQSSLPLASGDSFHSDPTVDWTSDGTAWSTTIGINSAGTVLKMRAYRSTDGGATWTLDNTFSGTQSSADKQMMWTDHSASSSFKDSIYAIWHNGNPVFFNRRRAGSWLASPVQISGSETTGTGIGADVKTNSAGEVFAMWPDTGSSKLYLTKSTDGGGTWGARTTVATTFDSFDIGVPSFNNRRMLIYVAVGTYKAGTKNNVYTVWNDLSGASGCTAPANEPGSSTTSSCKSRIWFARSTDGGATWGAKVKINDQSGLNDQFNPWLAVDETNGKIAVMYYDTVNDAGRKKVDVYYQSSSNDGSTWSTPLKVTTATTDETAAGADSGNQ